MEQLVERLAFRGDAAFRIRVALVGRPNAGKSSLFNVLAGHAPHAGAPALVSDQPGTTRDYLTADLELDGVKCQLIDTAGIDDRLPDGAAASVERAAQDMAREQLRTAHVRVVCLEAGVGQEHGAGSGEQGAGGRGKEDEREGDLNRIVVHTKCDKIPYSPLPAPRLETSAVTGAGVCALKEAIRAAALRAAGPQTDAVVGTAVRCGESLRLASASLDRAAEAVRGGLGEELIATEIRVALTELGKVAGAVYTDDVLDRIFSRFCIGK